MVVLNKLVNSTKAKVAGIAAVATAGVAQTFCDVDVDSVMGSTKDFIFKIMTWGGFIIAAVGIVMLGKAIMDSAAGQAQPGALGKALGVLILGILMLAGKSLLTAIGAAG